VSPEAVFPTEPESYNLEGREDAVELIGHVKNGVVILEGEPRLAEGTRVRVEPIDLSPMIFDFIAWGGRRLEINPPLKLEPTMDDESGQLYTLVDSNLGIDVFARTREQLVDELAEQVFFTWDAYANEAPEKLTSAARRLRETILGRMRESNFAT
jgi:hypothetical protein